MADVELVIKIPEETYEYWKEHKYEYVFAEAISKGVILPKGHGRLIDGSKLENLRFSERSNVWLMDKILKSKTIVEADNE